MCTRTDIGLLALGTLLAGCHVSHHKAAPSTPTPLVIVPEVEVNDFAWQPQNLGGVHGGMQVQLEGSITDQGWDPRDGFRFVAQQPLVVNVELDAHVPGVDLDWCVWDAALGDYTVCAETGLDPEVGSFIVPAGAEFHLVVSSFAGTSSYSMWVGFSTYFGATVADAPVQATAPERHDPKRRYGERDKRDDPFRMELRTWVLPAE